jgi:hypothetical protein
MSTLTALKSRHYNRLEGVALSAILQGLPFCAAVTILLKVHGKVHLFGHPAIGVVFAATTSILYALLVQYLGFRFPDAFRDTYEPLFYDPGLSVAGKVRRWITRRRAFRQVFGNAMLMILVAVLVWKSV